MSNHSDSDRPIIIRNVKKVIHKHHGGSWKIAYADFVTAMMTFFLLMWLLSLLNKYQLEGIAKYFKKPLKEAFTSQQVGSGKNVATKTKSGPLTYDQNGFPSPTKNPGVDATNNNVEVPFQSKPARNSWKGPGQTISSEADLNKLKGDLEQKVKNDPVMSQFKNQINFIVTADGLKIVIKDMENKPMFSEGGTDFEHYAVHILAWLSQQMNLYSNKVMIIGHTDATPYSDNADYTNWELSADRANATRRVLENSGIESSKVIRVVGEADSVLLDKVNPQDPANRRIEIIMLNDKATKQIENQ